MSLLPFFARDLRIDAPTAGHVISAYALGVVVGAPLIAVLSARIARRTLLIGLMLLFALANGLTGLAPDYRTMLLLRFLSGLPHGAYFGIAMLMAASLVPQNKRAQAAARVLLGLTVATTIGVPLANWLGQVVGWRWGFAIVAVLALLDRAVLVWGLFAPHGPVEEGASPLRELRALKNKHVWLTLAVESAIGFGGLFAVYTYLASTMLAVTGVSAGKVPIALAVFGIGMTTGNIVIPRYADRAILSTAGFAAALVCADVGALYVFAALNFFALLADILAIGLKGGSAGHCTADKADGCGGRGPGVGSGPQPFCLQHRQRLGALAGRSGDRGWLWLDIFWLGWLWVGASGLCNLVRQLGDGLQSGCQTKMTDRNPVLGTQLVRYPRTYQRAIFSAKFGP